MIDLDKMPFKYWSDETLISYLQRRVIVYSIIYYNLNDNCIPDKSYDEYANKLAELQSKNKEAFENSQYYYCMKDFDKSTGFDLMDKLSSEDKEYLVKLAKFVLWLSKEESKSGKLN